MAATEVSDVSDGPVLSVINKRIRALKKKLNRISQMEDSLAKGKTLNKEQEETLRTKPAVLAGIDELEKLRQPLSAAVEEEISLSVQRHQVSAPDAPVAAAPSEELGKEPEGEVENKGESDAGVVIEDLLNLLYFGSMFDVKTLQNHFTEVMLSREHERGSCLSYDYMKDDDSIDLLGEGDLDLLSLLSGLLISRPANSSLPHKNALQKCIEHAKLWLENSTQPIEPDSNVTYAELRLKLNKIMASQYLTAAPVGLQAATMNYGAYQAPVHESVPPVDVPVQVQVHVEDIGVQYQQKGEVGEEDLSALPTETEAVQAELEGVQGDHLKDVKEQENIPRRSYQNYRGGRGSLDIGIPSSGITFSCPGFTISEISTVKSLPSKLVNLIVFPVRASNLPLVRVAEHIVRLRYLFELRLRFLLVLAVLIRMPLHRQPPVRLLQILFVRILRNSEYIVVIHPHLLAVTIENLGSTGIRARIHTTLKRKCRTRENPAGS
nr:ATP-dependent RNA helicase A-like protein [Ipomoea batatas]